MKKILLLVFSAVLMMSLIACSNQKTQLSHNERQSEKTSEKADVREIVWSQLSPEQRERIKGIWKDGKVSKITLSKNMMSQVEDKSYEGKEVYLIDFPTKNISEPNNMIVYADINTFDYIGNGLVE